MGSISTSSGTSRRGFSLEISYSRLWFFNHHTLIHPKQYFTTTRATVEDSETEAFYEMCFSYSLPYYTAFFLLLFLPHRVYSHTQIGATLATELSSFLPFFLLFLIFFVTHSLKGGGCMVLVKTGRWLGREREPRLGSMGGFFFKGNTGEDGAVDRYGHVHWMTLQNGILSRRNCKSLRAATACV